MANGAAALYAQALTDAQRRPDLLREGAGLVDHLAPPLKALHDVQLWRTLIQKAQQGAQ